MPKSKAPAETIPVTDIRDYMISMAKRADNSAEGHMWTMAHIEYWMAAAAAEILGDQEAVADYKHRAILMWSKYLEERDDHPAPVAV